MNLDALPQLAVNGLFTGSLYALIAVSWGLIFSTTGIFHFAHALTLTVGGYLAWLLSDAIGFWPGLLVAALVAGAFGVLTDVVLYRPLRRRGALQLNVFLASLGFLIAGEAVVQFVFGPNSQGVSGFTPTGIVLGPVAFTTIGVVIAAVSWTAIAALGVFLVRSRYGLAIRGVESNPALADAFGISRQRIFWLVFLIGSVCAGLAGGLVALRDAATPVMGVAPVLAGFVAVFIGGIGSHVGAVLGGLLLGLAENLGGVVLQGQLQVIVAFVLLFLVLVLRPTGLFARGAT